MNIEFYSHCPRCGQQLFVDGDGCSKCGWPKAPTESKAEEEAGEITGIASHMMGLEPTTADSYGGIPRTAEPPQPSVQGEQDWEWEVIRDPEFLIWLNNFLPDWKLSYSGDIEGMWQAYKAGRSVKSAPSITSERIAEIANEPTPCSTYVSATKYRIEKALREAGVRVG